MRKNFLVIFFLSVFQISFSQKGNIRGILIDTAGSENPIGYATLSVFKSGDSVLTTYQLSDENGKFAVKNLALNTTYRLVINAFQYAVERKEVTLTDEKPDIDLGKIILVSSGTDLEEFVVKGEVPPIFVRNDTIEFNAASFKTLPSAVVEDLLKKLPGVTVGKDGSIMVNGREVSKILVDGRDFFGGDQKIATKNLPADIIDKIQVSDDKEALRQNPDLIPANTPQIINLKLKKEIKKGAFGKVYAGAGPNSLYESGGIMNLFKDTTQISILGYANNVNKSGFGYSDIDRIGGFDRSGVESIMMGSDGEFEINGISFGGASGGQQTSSGGGANFNTIIKKGLTFNTSYFYGQSTNRSKTISDIQQNIGDGKLITQENSSERNTNYNHNISSRLLWKIDTLSSLNFKPTVKIKQLRNNGLQTKENRNENLELLSNNYNNVRNTGTVIDYGLSTDYYKTFKKAGRNFYMNLTLNKSDNQNDLFNTSHNIFYKEPDSTLIDQLRDNNIRNTYYGVRYNYSEPIHKKFKINVSGFSNFTINENALYTFYRDSTNNDYLITVPDFTETVIQKGLKNNFKTSITWKIKESISVTPGINFNSIDLKNSFTKYPSFEQHYTFLAPSLSVRLKQLSISYSVNFSAPDIRYIQPVTNNSDPLFIQNGNPRIVPATEQNIYMNLYDYNTKKSLSYSFYLNGSIEKNSVVMSRTIDSNGVQTSTPINANGVISVYNYVSVGKEFKTTKNQFSIYGGYNLSYNRNLIVVNQIQSYAYIISASPQVSASLNLNDKIEISESYYLTFNKSTYENPFYRDIRFFTHQTETELIVRLPKKFVWETNYRLQYNTQKVAGFNNYIRIWNAGLTYLFMKNDRAQLKLSINDILNTNNRRNIYITANSVNDVVTNNLGRHGLLTFTYNIQNFGQKVGGRERFFGF